MWCFYSFVHLPYVKYAHAQTPTLTFFTRENWVLPLYTTRNFHTRQSFLTFRGIHYRQGVNTASSVVSMLTLDAWTRVCIWKALNKDDWAPWRKTRWNSWHGSVEKDDKTVKRCERNRKVSDRWEGDERRRVGDAAVRFQKSSTCFSPFPRFFSLPSTRSAGVCAWLSARRDIKGSCDVTLLLRHPG